MESDIDTLIASMAEAERSTTMRMLEVQRRLGPGFLHTALCASHAAT